MTKSDFPGPALSEEQWDRLKGLAVSLSAEQSTWVSGYFSGYADAARALAGTAAASPPPASLAPVAPAQRTLTILYGSETGNGIGLAADIAKSAEAEGLTARVVDMADYRPASLKDEQDLVIVASTHGEGDPAQPALAFFEFLDSRKAPRLDGLRFAVLALGDSTYEFYCAAGKRLDARLEALGGQRLAERIECDVDQLAAGRQWAVALLGGLAADGIAPAAVGAVPAVPGAAVAAAGGGYGEANPFGAEILENLVLTGRGSSKETRHLELALAGSGLSYEPGDALGIVGRNAPDVVDGLLEGLGLDGSAGLVVDGAAMTVGEALATRFEITTATPRFIAHWAELTGAAALAALSGPDNAAARLAYLAAHHVIDIVREFPLPGVGAERFVAGLRGLQPRLYSIASSQPAQDGDVHLTVSTVRYTLNGSARQGVVSGGLGRLEPGDVLPVYVKPNPHFRLPADDVPVVMIGAGTGVAPYRAFLQERARRGASGRAWLFFGERNFRSDFLYQTEWQEYLRDGALTWMDVAFSRDGGAKHYVQHRLRERGHELYGWLQDGAHVYVCGDAKGMAPDVHQALIALVGAAGALPAEAAADYVRQLQQDGRYQRDVY